VGLVTSRTGKVGTAYVAGSTWTYSPLGHTLSQTVSNAAGTVAAQTLEYGDADEITKLATTLGGMQRAQYFTYDARHQLTEVTDSNADFSANYSYGDAGRLTAAYEDAPHGLIGADVKPRDVIYHYDSGDPELVTSLTDGISDYATYTYDAAGNQITKVERDTGDLWVFTYDGGDRLRRAVKYHDKLAKGYEVGSEEYWYGNGGARTQIVRRDASGSFTELVWFDEGTEAHYSSPSDPAKRTYANISLGTPLARISRNCTGAALEFQFHGLANSTLAAISSTGVVNASFYYAPFGEVITATSKGDASAARDVRQRRFNDKQHDDLTGLIYYGARYYDRTLIGWTQLDPLFLRVPDLGQQSTPRRSNLGVFSLNSPTRYMDPDGRNSVGLPYVQRPPSPSEQFNNDIRSRMAGEGGYVEYDCAYFSAACSSGAGGGVWGGGMLLPADDICDGIHGFCDFGGPPVASDAMDTMNPRVQFQKFANQAVSVVENAKKDAEDFLDKNGGELVRGAIAAGVAYYCVPCGLLVELTGASNDNEIVLPLIGFGLSLFGGVKGGPAETEDSSRRFVVDPKGNTLIEPAGGTTVGNSQGTFVETRFRNGSPAQQLHGPHKNYPQSHGHGFKPGPGMNQRGPSLDPTGNVVPFDSIDAHWPVNK
jgi:RHS repeat-associated protein